MRNDAIQSIDITEEQLGLLLSTLRCFLPGAAVWAYGSRVQGSARRNSDLDLVVFPAAGQSQRVYELKEALDQGDLPFLVDLHVWDELPESFHAIISREYVVIQQPADSEDDLGAR